MPIEDESKHGCILMEYVDGRPLDEAWGSYDEVEKENINAQLKQYLDEVRKIPATFVGSVDYTYCKD